MNREEILKLLENRNIDYIYAEHPAVFTMEEMRQLHLQHEDDVALNLFLRDDKKRNYYLISTDGNTHISLKALRHILGSRPLSFAGEYDLERITGLKKGSVSPLGILNDRDHLCQCFIDIRFENRLIGIHPLENTATVWMKGKDLFELLKKEGHTVSWADLNQML